tara:strand:+ start:84 stop:260 length:177 start_codon:yes stop_codon:yes gene_type:complete
MQMSRATQFIEFINSDTIPTGEEMKFMYTHLSKTEKLKKARKEYRKKLKKGEKDESNL